MALQTAFVKADGLARHEEKIVVAEVWSWLQIYALLMTGLAVWLFCLIVKGRKTAITAKEDRRVAVEAAALAAAVYRETILTVSPAASMDVTESTTGCFFTPGGDRVHLSSSCSTLVKSKKVEYRDLCKVCIRAVNKPSSKKSR